ncbi:hypothetical protein MK079_01385 [Candidatus Gracilibacteria bacterium]|nr:hypothetical protein [Candidatus Gracilibacteria bacterium]
MAYNFREDVIIPAWNLIKDDSTLKLLCLTPGLLSILFFSILLVYQSVYAYVNIFEKGDEAFIVLLNFFESGYLFEIIIAGILFFIIYVIAIPLFDGGLIQYIAKKDEGQEVSGSDFIGCGFYNFLRVFQYNNLFSEFKFISILNAYLFTLRFVGIEYLSTINILFFIVFIFSTLLNIFLAYAKYEMILTKKDLFPSCSSSAKIALFNFGTTMKLYFLMFLLNVRVMLNFLIFLSFPIAIITVAGIIASQFFQVIAIVILAILFIVCIFFLGYMAAVLDSFKAAIWYFAYKTGKANMERIGGK